jgi:hypothetical protein
LGRKSEKGAGNTVYHHSQSIPMLISTYSGQGWRNIRNLHIGENIRRIPCKQGKLAEN